MQVIEQAVVIQKVLVRQHRAIPAPDPLRPKIELPCAFHAAAPVTISIRGSRKDALVELEHTRCSDHIRAVHQTLTPLALQHRPLSRGDHGREGRVVIRSECQIIRNRDANPVDRARAVARHQETGLALHSGIRRGKIRHIRERHASELQPRAFEIHHLFRLIVHDPRRFDLPFRRFGRIVLARLAGGIHAAVKHREI